jgi:hypothetical protein
MILIELVFAVAIVLIGIAFLFKLPIFAFLATVPLWMYIAICLGTGAIFGATATNTSPVERPRESESLFAMFIRVLVNSIALGIVLIFVGGLALVFGLSLPLLWQDPILLRVVSSMLSLCLGYIGGTLIAKETQR